ncbi:MAG: 1-deoxy-D-xylulose-5-phosphate reductoisomerase [Phycisphaeraceae bacterium]|jgi:1-deoxy-D-xylulose-5-phosphate reductoisomerase|nr:1-deoxy-D-xylulose-5-phosphate reductoisomerase [Phycisphaeraceae bacterium]
MTRDGHTQRLIVLGSTGSIGTNTLRVVDHLNTTGARSIKVVGLAAGRNGKKLIEQARCFDVPAVAVSDPEAADAARDALPGTKVYAGENAALQLVRDADATDVSAAVVGSAGLPATLEAIRKGCRIGLANKETLIAAGEFVTPIVAAHGAQLIPVDSEHSAIFQCIQGQGRDGIRRVVLTASGGPFRAVPRHVMDNASVEEALNHPTWNMGPKITIDSATMMNKAAEIIEAHWLFGLSGDQIDVMTHPQSIIHSFVEFTDHSILAQMGPPDMKTPIQYALVYPDRVAGCSEALDWSKLSKLDFEPPDWDKYAGLKLAYEVIEAGGTAGAIFNAANETAVAAFLERKIPFGRIIELTAETLEAVAVAPADSLETILDADERARQMVQRLIKAQASLVR